MKIKVPISVDVNMLVDDLKLSKTKSKNLKYRIYYFLSRIVIHNDNYKLYESGYRKVSSVLMKKILGNKEYYTIIKLLTNPNDPIVETDQSWYNPTSPELVGYCKGYCLAEKYNTGETEYKSLPVKFHRKISRIIPNERNEMDDRYKFLIDQFEINDLKFDAMVFDYIKNLGNELLKRVDQNNPYQTKLVYNHIGRLLYYIDKIDKNEIWVKVSPDNHRLNSSFTGLPKILRPFILCNNQPLAVVDVCSSQPYILSTIMNRNFFNDTNAGYNLKTIYPEVYDILISKNLNEMNSNNSMNNSIEYCSTITNTKYSYSYSSLSSHSFMWCIFLTPYEIKSIEEYKRTPFYNGFYSHFEGLYYKQQEGLNKSELPNLKQKLKDTMMFVLFEDNPKHRSNNPYIKIFKSVYPGVDKWICELHKLIGSDKFSYLLQRAESYLLLDKISREFNRVYPNVPLFTIHDGIYTYQKYIPDLTGLILSGLDRITGVSGGVKTKYHQIVREPLIGDIDKLWEKIGKITTERKYKDVCGSVFNSNVQRGSDFLKNNGEIFK